MQANSRANVLPLRACGRAVVILVLAACGANLARADDPAIEHAAQEPLRQRIREMTAGLKDVPLPVIIEALTTHRVQPWRGEARETLLAAAAKIEQLIAAGEIEAARVNEAGNRVETVVVEAMRSLGIEAGRPRTESGRVRSTGYPDLEAEIAGTAFYIEVKTFSAATIDSSQRSFYLSPSTDFKVTRDAVHLLVAVELVATSRGSYRAQSVRWLDLSGLRCDLKYEFNASNRDLYRPGSGLVVIELPTEPADSESRTAVAPAAGEPATAEPADSPRP